VLRQGIQGISDLITVPGLINLDFADVKTIMSAAGSALMAIGEASGDTRATEAAQIAIASPLLDIDISGARGVLFNITGGMDMTLFEVNEAADIISQAAHPEANIIFGAVQDPNYDGKVKITVIATGFDAIPGTGRSAAVPAYPPTHQPTSSYSQSRPEYDRSRLYAVSSGGTQSGTSNNGSAPARQPQGYAGAQLQTPVVSNHPTGPLPAQRPPQAAAPVVPETGRPRTVNPPSLSPETGRQRIVLPPPVSDDLDEDEFEMEDDLGDVEENEPQSLPVPEPEAQPLQRPVSGQQRHIRRIDRSGAELPRGSRNTPSGDVIDIPAFLRKR